MLPALMLALGFFFWLAIIGFAVFAATSPCHAVAVRPGGRARVTWRYPFHAVRRTLDCGPLLPACVVVDEDIDGGPYFCARVEVNDGARFELAGGRDRVACARTCAGFDAAVFPH